MSRWWKRAGLVGAAIAVALVVAIATPRVGAADDEAAKEAKVRKLLEITGAAKMGDQVMTAMIDNFRRDPRLPPGFLDKFKELAKPDEMIEKIIPLYLKHFDEKTIDAAIAFYETPEGQAMLKAQPQVVQESMQIGQAWGEELARKAFEELQRERRAR